MGQVTFQLEANEAKAVQAFMKVVDAQHKSETGAKKIKDAHQEANKPLGKMSELAGQATNAFGMLAGAAGLGAVIAAGARVLQFFDEVKVKTDAAVQGAIDYRKSLTDLYEATSSFGFERRTNVARNVALLAKEMGTDLDLTRDVANAYRRQFGDQMGQEEFAAGRRGMLAYAAQHGGAATTSLIRTMRGMGIGTAAGQGAFRRQVAASAAKFGLTDEEMIVILERVGPTAEALGWGPEQLLGTVGTLSMGLSGRQLKSFASTTIQAMAAPSTSAVKLLGLKPEATPAEIFEAFRAKSATISPEERMRLGALIYGTGAAAGAIKMLPGVAPEIAGILTEAGGAAGAAAEAEDEKRRMGEAQTFGAQVKAEVMLQDLETTKEQYYAKFVRELGAGYQKVLKREHPIRQAISEAVTFGKASEAERAAIETWYQSLPAEEQGTWEYRWKNMTWEERFNALINLRKEKSMPKMERGPLAGGSWQAPSEGPKEVHYHNDSVTVIHPRTSGLPEQAGEPPYQPE